MMCGSVFCVEEERQRAYVKLAKKKDPKQVSIHTAPCSIPSAHLRLVRELFKAEGLENAVGGKVSRAGSHWGRGHDMHAPWADAGQQLGRHALG